MTLLSRGLQSPPPRAVMGFTLIEALISMTIFATSVITLLSIQSQLNQKAIDLDRRARMAQHAVTKLDEIRLGTESREEGVTPEGFRWLARRTDIATSAGIPLNRLEIVVIDKRSGRQASLWAFTGARQ